MACRKRWRAGAKLPAEPGRRFDAAGRFIPLDFRDPETCRFILQAHVDDRLMLLLANRCRLSTSLLTDHFPAQQSQVDDLRASRFRNEVNKR